MRRLVIICLAAAWLVGAGAIARADGPALLTISGFIDPEPPARTVRFDREGLEALGVHTVRTSTVWTDGTHEFIGPRLCDLLDHVGAYGTLVEARALNDYFVTIPIEDCRTYDVILALTQDGVPLTPRDRGPIWVVYPRDDHRDLADPMMNSRWIWQLSELIVR